MPYMNRNSGDRPDFANRRRGGMHRRKKVCVFCGKEGDIDYKDVIKLLRKGYPIRQTAKLADVSESTVKKVKAMFGL